MAKVGRILALLGASLLLLKAASAEISDYAIELSQEWAPLIWLHPEEVFFPSTVEFYIQEMQVRDLDETVVQEEPTASTVVSGPTTEDYHLNTVEDIECVNCFEDFFFGQTQDEDNPWTVYTHIREYDDDCTTVDIKYTAFYPYNYGKDVCIGIPHPDGSCTGHLGTYGNHLSDWQGAEIRFRFGVPTDMYLGAHS